MAGPHNQDRDIPKAKISLQAFQNSMRLFRYMSAKNRGWFLLGTLFLAISAAASLMFPKLLGELMDGAFVYGNNGISKAPNTEALEKVAVYFVYLFIVQAVFSFGRIAIYVRVTEDMTYDIAQIQDAFTTNLAMFLRQILVLIGGVVVLFITSTKLAVLMLATLPAIIIIALVFGRFLRKKSKELQDTTAANNVIVEESLSGILSVKSFTNEQFESDRYGQSAWQLKKDSILRGYWRGAFSSFIIICMFGAIVWLIYQGLGLVQAGEMGVGELFNFMILTAFVGSSIGGMAEQFVQIQKTLGSIERVLELIDTPTELSTTQLQSQNSPNWQGAIALNGVSFSYPSRPEFSVFKNLNLTINPGEVLALVGPSGSGKSTLASLLYQFYQPTNGNITLSDKQVTEFDLAEYRQGFALVPQEVLLFGGSIYDNIRYGKPDATTAEIEAAARSANAADFIEAFPEKYLTKVGDRGMRLSGGQKQRIAIARAILRNPKVLILDEATSALDSDSELEVQKALQNLMQNRTSIVIAHRLSTIRHAHTIALIKHGEIVEQGNHESLMKLEGGQYRRMVEQQIDPSDYFQQPNT
ncbi:MAG: ATP-binding cassette domain-containing protein [Bacteroidetes bacterium]|nr:ATP-binding cassette domain-containing protein [Bacteroidota bacterium]